jgi:hypothetical protein
MALIAAVLASLVGIVAGVLSAILFDASLFQAAVVYFCMSMVTMSAFAIIMLFRTESGPEQVRSFEDVLDGDWKRFSELEAQRMTPEEEEFQAELDTPLEAGEMLGSPDRRRVDATPDGEDRRRVENRRRTR